MYAANLRAAATVTACILLTGACYATGAPRHWLPEPSRAQQEAWGAWIRVQMTPQSGAKSAIPAEEGELIAAGPDSLHVLTATGLASIPTAAIKSVRAWTYESNRETLSWWTLAGTLSTPSHGFGLALTAPAWIVTGAIAASVANKGPMIDYAEALRPYARFPQGIPAGLDRSVLRIKRR